MQLTATHAPTGVISNMVTVTPSTAALGSCFTSPCSTRFVEVPVSVHMPPSSAAYDSGIMSFDTGVPVFIAHDCTNAHTHARTHVHTHMYHVSRGRVHHATT